MNYPQVYLEERKHKIKKTKMTTFINNELEPDSDSKSELELESKSDLESDSEQLQFCSLKTESMAASKHRKISILLL